MGSRRLMVNISGLSSDCSDLITINQDCDMVLIVTECTRVCQESIRVAKVYKSVTGCTGSIWFNQVQCRC